MINYVEKGVGLHDFLASEGVQIEQLQSSEWVSTASDERTNNLIASYNPWPVEKARKAKEVNEWLSCKVAALTADVTREEKDTWQTQANEAVGLEPICLLAAMAHARGITVEQMIEKVKRNRSEFNVAYGKLQGEKDRILDIIKTLPDNDDYHMLSELWALKCMD